MTILKVKIADLASSQVTTDLNPSTKVPGAPTGIMRIQTATATSKEGKTALYMYTSNTIIPITGVQNEERRLISIASFMLKNGDKISAVISDSELGQPLIDSDPSVTTDLGKVIFRCDASTSTAKTAIFGKKFTCHVSQKNGKLRYVFDKELPL